jgi:hypothetical protein
MYATREHNAFHLGRWIGFSEDDIIRRSAASG